MFISLRWSLHTLEGSSPTDRLVAVSLLWAALLLLHLSCALPSFAWTHQTYGANTKSIFSIFSASLLELRSFSIRNITLAYRERLLLLAPTAKQRFSVYENRVFFVLHFVLCALWASVMISSISIHIHPSIHLLLKENTKYKTTATAQNTQHAVLSLSCVYSTHNTVVLLKSGLRWYWW